MTPGERPPPDIVGEAVAEIVRHAVAHPGAKDAIEGICRWWLPGGGERWSPDEVEAALEWLTVRGWMAERLLAGRRVWAVRAGRLTEMESWLRGSEERNG